MIQILSEKYSKHVSLGLLLLFYGSFVAPLYAQDVRFSVETVLSTYGNSRLSRNGAQNEEYVNQSRPTRRDNVLSGEMKSLISTGDSMQFENQGKADIDGPSQPEMSSFKSIGTNNMVDLFTGDFSYNIPLMDVGGYPINLFYSGGISMEQEASWVGLGWNINPGNVNRNMRGIPDDFNGTDTMIQSQKVKPNVTWGGRIGADRELFGIKDTWTERFTGGIGASFGLSFNNYLGPSMEIDIKGHTSMKLGKLASDNKSSDSSAFKVGGSLNLGMNSRYGLSFSPNLSLNANVSMKNRSLSQGLGVSTSYSSRNGLKDLDIYGQTSINNHEENSKKLYSNSGTMSTSISFARPSYTTALKASYTNESYSGHFQLGLGGMGFFGSVETEVYKQTSYTDDADVVQRKQMVGYMYYEKGNNNDQAVLDFTRLGDREVTPNTLIISAPQYTYDVFSIQGEGTGGSIRAYRNDYGVVHDKLTQSKNKSLSVGVDIGPWGHFGANFNTIKTPTTAGDWRDGNKIRMAMPFKASTSDTESVYFRNPGETSVLNDNQFDKVGGTDLVRFKLGGTAINPTVDPILVRYPKAGATSEINFVSTTESQARKKRTQVINMMTAEEASKIGLDTVIKNYDGVNPFNASKLLQYTPISRVSEYRKPHHISQINVTEADGKRYIYGVPVYNIRQKDFMFTVDQGTPDADQDLVSFATQQATVNSDYVKASDKNKDGFVQITETPAYAHSFLLSGLLSPDYVDVSGDGITDDDLGTAVKFNYSKIAGVHKWKTPLTAGEQANFNAGTRTSTKDDKGIVSYGERESWYLHSIESKTMIALFTLKSRLDGKGPLDSLQGKNSTDNTLKALDKIELYNKSDIKKNGKANAKPIKTITFEYSQSLCPGTPDNTEVSTNTGKLTLEKVTFSFNGQVRANKNQYVFAYGGTGSNPAYAINASDRWGNYKPKSQNPGAMPNQHYPYSLQDPAQKATIDLNASAWSLTKILLPSGGQMEVEYESDDYAFVQNKRAAVMMQVAGFGYTSDNTQKNNSLYDVNGLTGVVSEKEYVFINVPQACTAVPEVLAKYLQGMSQLSFKLAITMPRGVEYVPAYANVDLTNSSNYGFVSGSPIIWVRMTKLAGYNPLSIAAIEYLREQLPGQAYDPGYDVSEGTTMEQLKDMFAGLGDGIVNAFTDPAKELRSKGKAKFVVPANSFVRVNDPDGFKYGGGHRVRSVRLKDNWNAMTGQFTSIYGQAYDYTTTEVLNNVKRTISSGVASYEPGIGGEENPFQGIKTVADKLPLGPTTYGAVELPILDAFFPAPVVGYSQVTVRSLRRNHQDSVSRSGIGRQVTQFYTAKDFPVYANQTELSNDAEKVSHLNPIDAFFYKNAFNSRALSQGFLVETNDMHGKMKSQSSYGAKDTVTRINYTENFYRNTGTKGLTEKFDFVSGADGSVKSGNMGIDVELMTDTREFSVKSYSLEIQGQVDQLPIIVPAWFPFIWPIYGESENTYRAVTTTKIVNYHSIVDCVLVIDKGSAVTTRNQAFDAETGSVLVNRTNNEFDKAVYSTNYPAYWGYSGMGLAYKNIDAVYRNITFRDGRLIGSSVPPGAFQSGDEIYILNIGYGAAPGCDLRMVSSDAVKLIWAYDINRNKQMLPAPVADLIFMDKNGNLYTKFGVTVRIVRSGRRNMLGESLQSVVSMVDPVVTVGANRKLSIGVNSKVISSSAAEYKEKWQSDDDVFKRYRFGATSTSSDGFCYTVTKDTAESCVGDYEPSINPYRKGLMGLYRGYKSMIYYGSRIDSVTSVVTNITANGYVVNYKPYWDFNASLQFCPDYSNKNWLWNIQSTRFNSKGLQLETKDALNVYSSAQYGYKKSMPVAITNNSRSGESGYEGFEDWSFSAEINNDKFSCTSHQFDFPLQSGGTLADPPRIVNTDSTNFNAHTGKSVFKVGAGVTASNVYLVKDQLIDSFDLKFVPTSETNGFFVGDQLGSVLFNNCSSLPTDSIVGAGRYIGGLGNQPVNPCSGPYNPILRFFFQATQTGNIIVPASISHSGGSYIMKIFRDSVPLSLATLATATPIGTATFDAGSPTMVACTPGANYTLVQTPQFPLCNAKFYQCVFQYFPNPDAFMYCPPGSGENPPVPFAWNTFGAGVALFPDDESLGPIYQNLKRDGTSCNFTKPLPGKDSLANPLYSIPSAKKMLLSAWVKEACPNAENNPCQITTYLNTQIQLLYNGGGSPGPFTPTGPIIDGWQRIETVFEVPPGNTNVIIKLVNSGANAAYFDDIRIHPFNANMTSYVYDPVNMRLTSQLDANNYASFYEYDEEGTLIRTKVETKEGIKTISENRQAKQKSISTIQ